MREAKTRAIEVAVKQLKQMRHTGYTDMRADAIEDGVVDQRMFDLAYNRVVAQLEYQARRRREKDREALAG